MIATPTFVILNGVVLGALFRNLPDFTRLQTKLVDRGLFLLLVGHYLIGLGMGQVHLLPLWSRSTDAIGVAMVLGSFLVPRLDGRTRLALSGLLYAYAWLAVYTWHPATPSMTILKDILVGRLTSNEWPVGSFPVIQWVAVSLASSVIGERLAVLHRQGAITRMARELALLGGSAVALAVAAKFAVLQLGLSPAWGEAWMFVRIGQKYPPAPLYLLFYGGFGLLLVLTCLVAETRQWWRRALRVAETCGEVSLFVFIAHFYLFWHGLYHLGPGGPALGLVYFTGSVAVLVLGAREWQRRRFNRYFTIGYEAAYRRFAPVLTLPSSLSHDRAWQQTARG
jgi:hypothetical protein